MDLVSSYFHSVASVCRTEAALITTLSDAEDASSSAYCRTKFQVLTPTCPDFFFICNHIRSQSPHLFPEGNNRWRKEMEVVKAYRLYSKGDFAQTTRHELPGTNFNLSEMMNSDTKDTHPHVFENYLTTSSPKMAHPCFFYTVLNLDEVPNIMNHKSWASKEMQVPLKTRIFSSHADLLTLQSVGIPTQVIGGARDVHDLSKNGIDHGCEQRSTSHEEQISDCQNSNLSESNPLVVGVCRIDVPTLGNIIKMQEKRLYPENLIQLSRLLHELHCESTCIPVSGDTSTPATDVGTFLSLTERQCSEYVRLEYVCLCVSPCLLGGGGLKGIESRLDALLSRSSKSSRDASLMQRYNDDILQKVQHHFDQLMEQVTDSDAHLLQNAESNIVEREDHTQSILIDVEGERRDQEGLLRAMRAAGQK